MRITPTTARPVRGPEKRHAKFADRLADESPIAARPMPLQAVMDAVTPYLTTPVVAGSALALLLTVVVLALGIGRPKKGRRGAKAKAAAKPVASPKAKASKATPAKVTKAPPTTPGDDVRRSARCVTCANLKNAARLLTGARTPLPLPLDPRTSAESAKRPRRLLTLRQRRPRRLRRVRSRSRSLPACA